MGTIESAQNEQPFLDKHISSANVQLEFMGDNLKRLIRLSEKISGPSLPEAELTQSAPNYSGSQGGLQKTLDETHALNVLIQEQIEKLEKFV